jgi:anti-anti-sigma regulatory factor
MVVGPAIARADIPRLCERLATLLDHCGAAELTCDVAAVTAPDGVTIEALARLQLTARRRGRRIRLYGACGELRGLLRLTGLAEVLPLHDGTGHILPADRGPDPDDPPPDANPGDPSPRTS